MKKVTAAVLVLCLAYATVRYNLFQGVAWSDWPLFILNKACSAASILLLLLSAVYKRRGLAQAAAELLGDSFTLALLHVGFSYAILSPAYFQGLFAGPKLTVAGNLCILAGVSALVVYFRRRSDLGALAALLGLHVLVLGYARWFTPAGWPGYMPPISLISFLAAFAVFAVKNRRRAPERSAFGPRREPLGTESRFRHSPVTAPEPILEAGQS